MGVETKMNVLLDTSPLKNDNSVRGVGVYTRFLSKYLQRLESVKFRLYCSDQVFEHDSIDIIHYPFFDLFFRTLPLKKGNQKIVVTIHDVIPLLFPKYYPVGFRGRANFWLQKRSLRNIDAVITDSLASKKDIHRYLDIPLSKIHVVYLAGNPQVSKVSQKAIVEVKNKYNLPESYILYVGDINYNKNVVSLIESLTLVNESIHLVCVGKNFHYQLIPEWQRIYDVIRLKQLENRVHFITQLSEQADHELSAFYSGADLYVQPSLYEGFGLTVLEALQCGTPVVAGKNSSLLEIGGEVVGFAQTSPEGLAEQIISELSAGKKNDKVWRNKVASHLNKFSWEKTATQTVDVYQKLFDK